MDSAHFRRWTLGALARRWRDDRRGAAAVQFIAILPVFILVVIGLWAFFSVYSARDALCDATREAARYLQVEGPYFPDGTLYPDDWETSARTIMESELKSHQWYELVPVNQDEVNIFPETQRRAPKDVSEVTIDEVPNNWFFVQVTKNITNPLAFLLPDMPNPNQLRLSCQSVAFFEGPPIGTGGPVQPPRSPCQQVPPCGGGGLPPTSTPCPPGMTCQPTPCPPCEP